MIKSFAILLIPAVQVLLLISGCGKPPSPPQKIVGVTQPEPEVGNDFPSPVTNVELRRAKFSHRTGLEKYEFTWLFEGNRFLIEGNKIPPDLINAILGAGGSANRIEGTWEIHDKKIYFVLDDVNGSTTRKCTFSIYFTGVIRIETPQAQYVFEVGE